MQSYYPPQIIMWNLIENPWLKEVYIYILDYVEVSHMEWYSIENTNDESKKIFTYIICVWLDIT